MGKGTVFAWQHDARLFDGGRTLTLFDDGSDPPVEPQSRALVLRLDTRHMTATLQKRFVHRPGRVLSRFMGNAQLLGNGNMLVGWGGAPYVSEFAPNGSTVFEARLPGGGQNYRAFRFPWVGRPSRPPRIKALPVRRLYVSWNGATEVAAWRLRSGKARGALHERGTVEKHGFETELRLPRGDRFAAAVALDAHGKPLGHTSTIAI
jgi:hypothetical protein